MVNNSKNSSDSGQVCDQDATPDSTLCLQLSQCQEPYIETPVYMDLGVITIGELCRPLHSKYLYYLSSSYLHPFFSKHTILIYLVVL